MIVAAEGEQLKVTMGAMNSVATAYTAPDSIRVEMIPFNGIAIPFTIESGRVTGLRAFDEPFSRCG